MRTDHSKTIDNCSIGIYYEIHPVIHAHTCEGPDAVRKMYSSSFDVDTREHVLYVQRAHVEFCISRLVVASHSRYTHTLIYHWLTNPSVHARQYSANL